MKRMKKEMKQEMKQNEPANETGVAEVEAGISPVDAAEIDALKTENEKLKTQIRMDKAHSEMTRRLANAGAWSPGLMFGAVTGDLQFDDEGKLLNGASVVDRLKRDFPESFVSGSRPGTIDGGAGIGRGNALTREALSKMSPEEIRKLDWEDVRRVLNER